MNCTVLIHEHMRRTYVFPNIELTTTPIRDHLPLQEDTLTPQLNTSLPAVLLEGFHFLSRHTFFRHISLIHVVGNKLTLRLSRSIPKFKTTAAWECIEDEMETHLAIVMEYPNE